MSGAFESSPSGILMRLDDVDETLLRDLREVLRASLLGDDVTDPIMLRMFPVPVEGDDVVASDVQSMIHSDLVESRVEGLDEILEILDRGKRRPTGGVEVELHEDEPHLVLGVINDLRLALAARIAIEHIDRDTLDPEDDRRTALAVIDHLAWLQEQLLRIVDPESFIYIDETPPEQLQ